MLERFRIHRASTQRVRLPRARGSDRGRGVMDHLRVERVPVRCSPARRPRESAPRAAAESASPPSLLE